MIAAPAAGVPEEPGTGPAGFGGMRRIAILLLAATLALPAAAQDGDEGFGLMERGFGMLMEGLGDEMAPMLRQLRELAGEIDRYEAPEKLPNGDIIIRRKDPADPPLREDEIEL